MGVRQTALILYLISELAVAIVPAYAVSCRWLEDRYVFVCGEARCAPRFRAREVLSHGSSICARRLEPCDSTSRARNLGAHRASPQTKTDRKSTRLNSSH